MERYYFKLLRQSAERKAKIRKLRKQGLILEAIAKKVGLSRQRVHQILQEK